MDVLSKDGCMEACELEGIKTVMVGGQFVPVQAWLKSLPEQVDIVFGVGVIKAFVVATCYEIEAPFFSDETELSFAQQLIKRLGEIPGEGPGTRLDENGDVICYYSGRPIEDNGHVDHVTPRCKGGQDRPENFVVSEGKTNMVKNGRNPVHWLMGEMANVPDDIAVDYVARLLHHFMYLLESQEK